MRAAAWTRASSEAAASTPRSSLITFLRSVTSEAKAASFGTLITPMWKRAAWCSSDTPSLAKRNWSSADPFFMAAAR